MAIPVYLQGFKSAGIYRVVWDRSTILNQDTATLRLVVGWSPKGPFNTPVYVKDLGTLHSLFGEGSKTLEKRGCYFHRMCEQALAAGPILALNLKKFANEKVDASTIDTNFNVKNPINTVEIPVEAIYDTTRFWMLSADKLNEINGAEYINIATTNTKATSGTYFIRKASGSKVSGYNITVSDWYKSTNEEIPEFLEGYENSMMSDFMAEIYVFGGRFVADQVLASNTLKKYFEVNKQGDLKLRPYVIDGFGDYVDTLDELYQDETSGAIGHYVGSLIPYFRDKNGVYAALDIVFNQEQDVHNMMMTFNVDMLDEEGIANIDLSGSRYIVTLNGEDLAKTNRPYGAGLISIKDIFEGTATTNLLGNIESPIVADKIQFHTSVYNDNQKIVRALNTTGKKITGTMYVKNVVGNFISLAQVGEVYNSDDMGQVMIEVPEGVDVNHVLYQLGAAYRVVGEDTVTYVQYESGLGSYFNGSAYTDYNSLEGPKKVITSINRDVDTDDDTAIKLSNDLIRATVEDVYITTTSEYCGTTTDPVYGSSISFIEFDDMWDVIDDQAVTIDAELAEDTHTYTMYCKATENQSLSSIIEKGDRFLAKDGSVDMDGDGEYDDEKPNGFYDVVSVQDVETVYDVNGVPRYHKIKFTGAVQLFKWDGASLTESINVKNELPEYVTFGANAEEAAEVKSYIVRIDRALNQEIGVMRPVYLEGYTYENAKPNGTGMMAKLNWQNFMLSALTDYKGLRTALLNKSEIDFRYVIDTFESYVDSSLKSPLAMLCKEKESAFAILNFPSVRTFVKCPYTSFTDSKGVFNVQYVVDGKNKKKAAVKGFSLPSNDEGASFCAFYTPLKFSDGYIDSVIPSAALVSNLYMNKYTSRHPYDIVAGPNYGAISAAGLIGPDYHYDRDELNIIEPFGVNCMVYRQKYGTFINANQTAKQTPKSALSSVNVRELVIFIMDEVEHILQGYQWEFNNPTVRNQIKDRADVLCEKVKTNGGLQTYLNVMDESNNTDELIDNEFAILSTHIEPGRGMGKMVHELTIYRTGAMKSNIITE